MKRFHVCVGWFGTWSEGLMMYTECDIHQLAWSTCFCQDNHYSYSATTVVYPCEHNNIASLIHSYLFIPVASSFQNLVRRSKLFGLLFHFHKQSRKKFHRQHTSIISRKQSRIRKLFSEIICFLSLSKTRQAFTYTMCKINSIICRTIIPRAWTSTL